VDRIRSVEARPGTFAPPSDLDPVAVLEENLALGWEVAAEVMVEAPVTALARCVPPALGRLEAPDDGGSRLVGTTSNPSVCRTAGDAAGALPRRGRP
jgi:hypothetical protein